MSKDLAARLKETSAKRKIIYFCSLSLRNVKCFPLTENRDEGKEPGEESGGDQDEDEGVELIVLRLLPDLLVQGVGGHGVVIVVEVPGGHRRGVLVLKCAAYCKYMYLLVSRLCVPLSCNTSVLLGKSPDILEGLLVSNLPGLQLAHILSCLEQTFSQGLLKINFRTWRKMTKDALGHEWKSFIYYLAPLLMNYSSNINC